MAASSCAKPKRGALVVVSGTFSPPIVDAALGRRNIKSVICLGKICTARRYPMTLQRHWPEVALFRERVLAEVAKIAPYKAQGFIADRPPARAQRLLESIVCQSSRRLAAIRVPT